MALLLALAALVLVLAALGAGLTALGDTRAEAAVALDDERLRDALQAGEQLARAWIAGHAASLVLPPAGGGVVIANDRWTTAAGTGGVAVVIYDGLAGIPAHLAHVGGQLRIALPDAFTGLVVPQLDPSAAGRPSDLLERLALPAGQRRFPAPALGVPQEWRDGTADAGSMVAAPIALAAPSATSLAQVISDHSDGRININTAPAELVAQAYRQLGLGEVEAVLERRRLGTFSTSPDFGEKPPEGVQLVGASNVWAALVIASSRDVQRRWWVVIAGNPQELRIVQRHDADE